MILDYRGNPVPTRQCGFSPTAPVAPKPSEGPRVILSDAIGFVVELEPNEQE